MSFDLINRDPNNINDHVQTAFEDVIAEPDGTHSIDCVWSLSHACFTCWKNCCYRMFTLLCGTCIAASLGCEFACISFNHIWSYTPCLKQLEINCTYHKRVWAICVGCMIEPCCIACGMFFHQFKKG